MFGARPSAEVKSLVEVSPFVCLIFDTDHGSYVPNMAAVKIAWNKENENREMSYKTER